MDATTNDAAVQIEIWRLGELLTVNEFNYAVEVQRLKQPGFHWLF
ncbi:MAG: hypothetical protein VX233_00045 [Candidatus Neomarinimicrobiota bacterium]|jgi:hypothetical protein|nr:hypothetical protein [Candidatus Neomarinimicrobiota bacterium]